MTNLKIKMMMEKVYKHCQSCGMPMKRDEQGGGTNAGGSKSTIYCSRCYENGAFTRPGITAAGMVELVKCKLVEMGFPRIAAWLFTKNIPRLKRWRN